MAMITKYRFKVKGVRTSRGFTLLIAVIFMSVVLALGLTLASLGYKQVVLSSGAIQSQYAFYAADAALECVLYADQKGDIFNYANYDAANPPILSCGGTSATITNTCYNTGACTGQLQIAERISLDSGTRCADITVYKPPVGQTILFSQGYNVSCASVGDTATRFIARGLEAKY